MVVLLLGTVRPAAAAGPPGGEVLSQVGRLTYYADFFEGRPHACAVRPPHGFSALADFSGAQPGLATGDRGVPCGTVVLLEVVGLPGWARGRYSDVLGRRVVGVVTDRLGAPAPHTYDAYPPLFAALIGREDWRGLGVVYVRATVLGRLPVDER